MFQQFLHVQQQAFFAYALVDDVAQALAAGLWGQSAACAAQLGHAFHDGVVDGAHPQRRQGKADLFFGAAVQHAQAQGLQGGIVSGAQREEGNFVKACFVQAAAQQAVNIFQGALSHRAIDHAGVAEAASARAAAGDFQREPVVHGPHGHHLAHGIGGLIDVCHNAPCRAGIIRHKGAQRRAGRGRHGREQRWHVHAGDAPCRVEQFLSGPAPVAGFFQQFQHVRQAFFAVAQNHQIHKWGQGLGAEQGPAAGHHQRTGVQTFWPVRATQGNTRQVQHIEHVGIAQLVGDGKTEGMRADKGGIRLQGGQGGVVLAQHLRGFTLRSHNPFSPPLGPGVDHAVEDLLAQVGHAHLVGIGKSQGYAQTDAGGIFAANVVFNARVAAGAWQQGQQLAHVVPWLGVQKGRRRAARK